MNSNNPRVKKLLASENFNIIIFASRIMTKINSFPPPERGGAEGGEFIFVINGLTNVLTLLILYWDHIIKFSKELEIVFSLPYHKNIFFQPLTTVLLTTYLPIHKNCMFLNIGR